MSSFTTALVVKQVGARVWEVTEGFDYEVGALGSGWIIHVPKGFQTDGASVPRFLWIFWPPFGGWWNQAATLHDWIYRTKFKDLERSIADVLLLDGIYACQYADQREHGASRWKVFEDAVTRWCIYLGVRAGGGFTWRRYRRAGVRAAVEGAK